MRRIISICRAGALAAIALAGAACSTTFLTGHEPMHPVSTGVWLKAQATGMIDRIELRMRRYSIDPDTGVETPDTQMMVVEVCDPAFWVDTLRCSYRAPWSGDHKMIEFEATAVQWNGTKSVEVYKFASGEYPFPEKPVPIRVKGPTVSSLDVVIVPDDDLLNSFYVSGLNPDGDWDGFRWFLDDIVENDYFKYSAIRHWRGLYNFYYSLETGQFNEAACSFSDPANIDDLMLVADSLMYAHSQEMWDCKLGDRFSSENWYDKSVAHETGHALFGLRDEYRGANYGAYPPHACMSNIFPSKAACAAEAPSIGLPASLCTLIDPYWNVWRIDPADATGSIMGEAQHYGWSGFGRASLRRMNWRYDKCLNGDCMAPDPCD